MLKVLFSKKFKIMLLLIFFLFFYTFKVYAKNNDFSHGTGTKDDPYIISNAHELQNVGNYCGKEYENTYFKIEVKDNKLDMSDIKNFKPICGVDNTIVKDESVFFV